MTLLWILGGAGLALGVLAAAAVLATGNKTPEQQAREDEAQMSFIDEWNEVEKRR